MPQQKLFITKSCGFVRKVLMNDNKFVNTNLWIQEHAPSLLAFLRSDHKEEPEEGSFKMFVTAVTVGVEV